MNMQKQSLWAIGFGCRTLASTEAIIAAVLATLAKAKSEGASPCAYQLFTLASKAQHAPSHEAAQRLGVALRFLKPEEMRPFMEGTTYNSARVEALVGIGSVAEAAALAGAGCGSRLLVPRMVHEGVSAALAAAGEGVPS